MKFNTTTKGAMITTNYMGGKSYKLDPATELYTAVVSTMLDDSYYEGKSARIERIRELVAKNDPLFVAKLAVYTREMMHLRSIPVVLAVELAKVYSGDSLVSKLTSRVVQRADEITEMLSYYAIANGRMNTKKLNKLSKQVQKGLADAFNKFDEYQFAKYNRDASVKLKDALFIVHPKAKNDSQQDIFNKIASDTLQVPYTWETELSKTGQREFANESEKAKAKAEVWEKLVLSGKMGYMAMLRNLRNIIQDSTSRAQEAAIEMIANKEKVLSSKQLPFRFLSAHAELEKVKKEGVLFEKQSGMIDKMMAAVEKAVLYSVDNIPVAKGRTLILVDNSGSMRGDAGGKSLISAASKRTTADIANLFAMLYWTRAEDTLIGLFGDRLVMPKLDRSAALFENFKTVDKAAETCGPATERGIFEMMEKLIAEKIMVDRIVIFSDCQVGTGCRWYDNAGRKGADFDSLYRKYSEMNPGVTTYSIDLKGYGNTLFSGGVMTISGWSDKIFDMMVAIEEGGKAVDEISKIEL